MATELNDNIEVQSAKPIENRFGPYTDLATALSEIDNQSRFRYRGLTIGVDTGNGLEEYWFKDGVEDIDLVKKTPNLASTNYWELNNVDLFYDDGSVGIGYATGESLPADLAVKGAAFIRDNLMFEDEYNFIQRGVGQMELHSGGSLHTQFKDDGDLEISGGSLIASDLSGGESGLAVDASGKLVKMTLGAGLNFSGGQLSIDSSVLSQLERQGTWDATTNTPAIPVASSANDGHFYIVQNQIAAGHGYPNIPDVEYKSGDWLMSDGTTWERVKNSDETNWIQNGSNVEYSGGNVVLKSGVDLIASGNISTSGDVVGDNGRFTNEIEGSYLDLNRSDVPFVRFNNSWNLGLFVNEGGTPMRMKLRSGSGTVFQQWDSTEVVIAAAGVHTRIENTFSVDSTSVFNGDVYINEYIYREGDTGESIHFGIGSITLSAQNYDNILVTDNAVNINSLGVNKLSIQTSFVAFSTSIRPNLNNIYDIGTSDLRFNNVYSNQGNFSGQLTTSNLVPDLDGVRNIGTSSFKYNTVNAYAFEGGSGIFTDNITVGQYIYHEGNTNDSIRFSTGNTIEFRAEGNLVVSVEDDRLKVSEDLYVDNVLWLGSGSSDSNLPFWNYNGGSGNWREIKWDSSSQRFELQDSAGVFHEIIHSGNVDTLLPSNVAYTNTYNEFSENQNFNGNISINSSNFLKLKTIQAPNRVGEPATNLEDEYWIDFDVSGKRGGNAAGITIGKSAAEAGDISNQPYIRIRADGAYSYMLENIDDGAAWAQSIGAYDGLDKKGNFGFAGYGKNLDYFSYGHKNVRPGTGGGGSWWNAQQFLMYWNTGQIEHMPNIEGDGSAVKTSSSEPSDWFVLASGTTDKVPLRFKSGVLSSSIKDGSIEYDGNTIYLSQGGERVPVNQLIRKDTDITVFNGNYKLFVTDDDSKVIQISGGSTGAVSSGSQIISYGDDHATNAGILRLRAGNHGYLDFYGAIRLNHLAGSGNRLVTTTSDGTIQTLTLDNAHLANGAGYITNASLSNVAFTAGGNSGYIPRFTDNGITIGNSVIQNQGTTVSIGGDTTINGNTFLYGTVTTGDRLQTAGSSSGNYEIRSRGHGSNLLLQAETSGGAVGTYITIDPDTSLISHNVNTTINGNLVADNLYLGGISTGSGIITVRTSSTNEVGLRVENSLGGLFTVDNEGQTIVNSSEISVLQIKGTNPSYTDVRISNSSTGGARLLLDGADGDFVGADYTGFTATQNLLELSQSGAIRQKWTNSGTEIIGVLTLRTSNDNPLSIQSTDPIVRAVFQDSNGSSSIQYEGLENSFYINTKTQITGDLEVNSSNPVLRIESTGSNQEVLLNLDSHDNTGTSAIFFGRAGVTNSYGGKFGWTGNTNGDFYWSTGGASLTEVMRLSQSGNLSISGHLTIPDYIHHKDDNSYFGFQSNDNFWIGLSGTAYYTFGTSQFRSYAPVKFDSKLTVDGQITASNLVTITNSGSPRLSIASTSTGTYPGINLALSGQAYELIIRGNASNSFQIRNSSNGTDLMSLSTTGNVDFLGSIAATGGLTVLGDNNSVRRGIHGGFNYESGGGSNWAATIWGIGQQYNGLSYGDTYDPDVLYGIAWVRGAHSEYRGTIGEGLYLYTGGNFQAGIGTEGIYTDGLITTSSYGTSSNWKAAYDYSQIGHLPLSGGEITNYLTISNSNYGNHLRLSRYGNTRNITLSTAGHITVDTNLIPSTNGTLSLGLSGNSWGTGYINTIVTSSHGTSSDWKEAYEWINVNENLIAYKNQENIFTEDQYFNNASGDRRLWIQRTDSSSKIVLGATSNGGYFDLVSSGNVVNTRIRSYAISGTLAWFTGGTVGFGTTAPDSSYQVEIAGNGLLVSSAIKVDNSVTLSYLAGSGTRMVVANASGVLSTQEIPSGTSYTEGNGISISGSVISTDSTVILNDVENQMWVDLRWRDDFKAKFGGVMGGSADLEIYSDSNFAYIDKVNGSGGLLIKSSVSNNQPIRLQVLASDDVTMNETVWAGYTEVRLYAYNTVRLKTTTTGVTVTGTVNETSDQRLKYEISKDIRGLESIRKLPVYHYYRTDNKGTSRVEEYGIYAQDVERIIPFAVERDEDGYLSVAHKNLMMLNMKAIQELDQQFQKINVRTARFEDLIPMLENKMNSMWSRFEAIQELDTRFNEYLERFVTLQTKVEKQREEISELYRMVGSLIKKVEALS